MLRARKPSPEVYLRALEYYDVPAENAFLADDSTTNVLGARAVGMTAHQLLVVDGVFQTGALRDAIEAFAVRNA
jgi:putative hydrolase of the HAD superfamily